MLQILIPLISGVFLLATPENEWMSLFGKYIKDWMVVRDKEILLLYSQGESTLYLRRHIMAWVKPIAAWGSLVVALIIVMACISVILRRRWTEQEKLSYPIIQLPLEMSHSGFWRDRLMWLGFALAGGMDVINGLHFLYPSVPGIGGKLYDIAPFFTEKPWNAIGWTPVALFPYAIGMAFFIPLDLSFSCWFFYLFWKVQRVIAAAIGLRSLPRFPYIEEQAFGQIIEVNSGFLHSSSCIPLYLFFINKLYFIIFYAKFIICYHSVLKFFIKIVSDNNSIHISIFS